MATRRAEPLLPPREDEVQALARNLAAGGAAEKTGVFNLGWLSDRLLDWAMAHPAFKTQLFRFVDVFPACRDDADVLRHLDEYFGGAEAPRVLGLGIEAAEHVPFGATLSAAAARRNVARMARLFIAGATPADALPRLARLWRAGEASTVDLLGERTITAAEADHYAARVLAVLEALAAAAPSWPERPHLERDPWGPIPRVNVSVKPTALTPFFAPLTADRGLGEARARLRPILVRARELGATIHFDTEHDEAKDLTLELVRSIGTEFTDAPHLGCVIQAYRRDAWFDLGTMIDWSARTLAIPLQIRLVKGAYWDLEDTVARAEGWPVPVFATKEETDGNYERCVRLLVARAGHVRPAIATHNLRSLAYAITAARATAHGERAIELQLLYGMAEPIHAALRQLNLRVRVYAPVGALVPGMAYLVRRLLENTSNESFIRHRFAEEKDLDELLAPPRVSEADLAALEVEGDAAMGEDAAAAALEGAAPEIAPPLGGGSPEPAVESESSEAAAAGDAPGPFRNEPHAELRRAAPRAILSAAIAAMRRDFGFTAPVVIDGRRVRTEGEIVSVDPGDYATVVCKSGRAGAAEAAQALTVAERAFPSWRATPWAERAAILFRAAAEMRARRPELAALEVFEAGKPPAEADADVCEAIDFCEYYGRSALALAAGAPVLQVPGERNAYRYHPRGVGAVIAPWNFPLAIPTGMVTAALVTGNCVLFKPSEQTPGLGARLVEILLAAGIPSGTLSFLPGAGEEVGAALVDDPRVAFVAFTGSKEVGLSIIERAAHHQPGQRHVKHVVAEMGGKNAIIVDSDADLDQAIPAIVQSAFGYAGQKCSAASRVIAVGPVADELFTRLTSAAALVPIGHARNLDTVVGPLIDDDAWRRVRGYQEIARREGEVLLARADVPEGGWYVAPTIVATARADARIATEEIFGPILVALRADDLDHALALAGATDYALTGGIFSRSPSHIRHAADEFRAGNLYVNRSITGARVGRQPFGGYGLSGVGTKAGGPDYLLQFVEPRVTTENTIRQGFAPPEE